MQPGSDFNPYAAPADQADRSMANMGGGYGPSGPLATLGQRLGGSMLDTLFLMLACAPGALIGLMINSASPDRAQDERTLVWAGLAGVGLLILSIYQTVLVSTTGQSLAKKMLKTKIVKLDGSPVGFVHGVLLRSWVVAMLGAIPFVGSFIGIVDAALIFREDRRTLHDHIAGTNVIQVL
jgi:uncharacterized RDD family membrane protein YckC